LSECQFPAYSVLKPIHIGGGGRFVNFYRLQGRPKTGQLIVRFSIIFLTGQIAKKPDCPVKDRTPGNPIQPPDDSAATQFGRRSIRRGEHIKVAFGVQIKSSGRDLSYSPGIIRQSVGTSCVFDGVFPIRRNPIRRN